MLIKVWLKSNIVAFISIKVIFTEFEIFPPIKIPNSHLLPISVKLAVVGWNVHKWNEYFSNEFIHAFTWRFPWFRLSWYPL